MGPKSFVECYVCLKEFGAKSISFHEPKCLERWRISNQRLPTEKRASTPVKPAGWRSDEISAWPSSLGKESLPFAKKTQLVLSYPVRKSLQNKLSEQSNKMTGVIKSEFSPKRGKENRNISNHIPTLSVGKNNAKNVAKTDISVAAQTDCETGDVASPTKSSDPAPNEESISTSKRSVRPQTKILRRPTPNLKHPVIQVDSDDSSGDSSCSDKVKEDNPKRLKMGSELADGTHKPKNFIMYNKHNVDKNTKNNPKERTSATVPAAIPNPCNSCNRSQAPERLHSHARKDARGLMNRKSPSFDVKMVSPQKKSPDGLEKLKVKHKELKSIASGEKHKSEDPKNSSEELPRSSAEQPAVEELVEPMKACYICQEQFKVSSLRLHESHCLESWKKTNNSLMPNLRKLPPRRPEEVEGDIPSTDEADPEWRTVQSQLIPCPLCGRTFFPERLPVHRRVCKGKSSPRPLKRASSMREQSASSRNEEEQKPAAAVYVPCYICGRQFGSWVISMHEQQCLRKWRRENHKLPDDQQMEEPQKLPGLPTDEDVCVASLVELGDNAWESHLQQLVPCPLCARTFFPNRLAVHKRSCKGLSGSQRPRSNRAV